MCVCLIYILGVSKIYTRDNVVSALLQNLPSSIPAKLYAFIDSSPLLSRLNDQMDARNPGMNFEYNTSGPPRYSPDENIIRIPPIGSEKFILFFTGTIGHEETHASLSVTTINDTFGRPCKRQIINSNSMPRARSNQVNMTQTIQFFMHGLRHVVD